MRRACALAALSLSLAACDRAASGRTAPPAPVVQPVRATEAVGDDPDDPAIWVDRRDPARSLIVATNKIAAPRGALVVFGLDGRIRQTIGNLDRPNNVDVEYGVTLDARTVDLVVTTERLQHQLRVFAVNAAAGQLEPVGSIPVLAGEQGQRSEPMGISLYRRKRDGATFAIVAPKTGGASDYLWQYRVEGDGKGGVTGTLVRRFGNFSQLGPAPGEIGEIEGIVVDDELDVVYYADERFGIHKWHADPEHRDAAKEIATIGTSGYERDREGLAIYAQPDGGGYLISTDQLPGRTRFKFYPRTGPQAGQLVHEAVTTADETDGIDVVSSPLPGFAQGLLVAMNSGRRNFLLFRWEDLLGK